MRIAMRRGRKKVVVITSDNTCGPCKTEPITWRLMTWSFTKSHHTQPGWELSRKKKEKYLILIGNGTTFAFRMFSLLDSYGFADVYRASYVMIVLCTEIPGNQILLRFDSFILKNLYSKPFPIFIPRWSWSIQKLPTSPLFSFLYCFLQFCKWNQLWNISLPSFRHVGFWASYVIRLNSETTRTTLNAICYSRLKTLALCISVQV